MLHDQFVANLKRQLCDLVENRFGAVCHIRSDEVIDEASDLVHEATFTFFLRHPRETINPITLAGLKVDIAKLGVDFRASTIEEPIPGSESARRGIQITVTLMTITADAAIHDDEPDARPQHAHPSTVDLFGSATPGSNLSS